MLSFSYRSTVPLTSLRLESKRECLFHTLPPPPLTAATAAAAAGDGFASKHIARLGDNRALGQGSVKPLGLSSKGWQAAGSYSLRGGPRLLLECCWGKGLFTVQSPGGGGMPRTCQGHLLRQAISPEWSHPKRVATCAPDGRAGGTGLSENSGAKMVLTGFPENEWA